MAVYDYKIQFYKLLSRTALHALCSISTFERRGTGQQAGRETTANRTRGGGYTARVLVQQAVIKYLLGFAVYGFTAYLRPSESRSASAGTRTTPGTSQLDERLLAPPSSYGSSSRLLNRSRKASTSVRCRSLTTGGAGWRAPLSSSASVPTASTLAGCASIGSLDSVAFEARQLAS